MDFSEYQGKRVVVTGCSSGIGEATARALVDLGAEVLGASRNAPSLELAQFVPLDLADPASIETAVSSIGGHVDALFNVAGAPPMIDPLDVLKVNFLGTRLFTEGISRLMTDGGAIASVSSDGGYAWRKKRAMLLDFLAVDSFADGLAWYEKNQEEAGHPYAFGKEALNVWTMRQSAQLIRRGIRINTVSPGAVQTPMLEQIEEVFPAEMIAATEYPSGRRSTSEEQVGPLLFINGSGASYVNGADLVVDGGFWASLSVAGQLWD